ncbi:MAG: alpha-L-fucosidase [Opitutaceae bacterium]
MNVGPTAEGTIPEQSQTNLREVGKWLRRAARVSAPRRHEVHPFASFGHSCRTSRGRRPRPCPPRASRSSPG